MTWQPSTAAGLGPVGRPAAILLLAVTAGCGQPQGRVTGRVLLDGQPVPGGILMFMAADLRGQGVAAAVDESGTYSVVLPPGEVLVSFDNRQLAPPAQRGPTQVPKGLSADVRGKLGRTTPPPAPPEPAAPTPGTRVGRYVKVPDRYAMTETADLRFTVKPGIQQHEIELSSKP